MKSKLESLKFLLGMSNKSTAGRASCESCSNNYPSRRISTASWDWILPHWGVQVRVKTPMKFSGFVGDQGGLYMLPCYRNHSSQRKGLILLTKRWFQRQYTGSNCYVKYEHRKCAHLIWRTIKNENEIFSGYIVVERRFLNLVHIALHSDSN